MINILSNKNTTITYLIFVLIIFPVVILFKCTTKRKERKQNKRRKHSMTSPLGEEVSAEEKTDVNCQAELLNDYLSNVELLAPTLPGGCMDDENAAKEAYGRYSTNSYLPKLEIQSKRIVNDMIPSDLIAMVKALPKHPPRRFKEKKKTESVRKETREQKWKDVHVNWHSIGLVFIVRSSDPCRAIDEGVVDTVDSLDAESPGKGEEKVNSEMTMSQRKTMNEANKKKGAVKHSKKSKRSRKELPLEKTMLSEKSKSLDKTQTETQRKKLIK
ncbi:unnamed protein product [Caenorhabditis angaria]|uniref:Uncharacterized protein n=1 Tax=Caenorhabditis angaria TaxID=860376 RepID=A0A9P1IAX8_9PELO|nr:unnamed protein product [Caenorhabditis angaria]